MHEELWAVDIEGPDTIMPAESFEEADRRAREINDWYRNRPDPHHHDPVIRALVVHWQGGPERHAEMVARGPDRWRDLP